MANNKHDSKINVPTYLPGTKKSSGHVSPTQQKNVIVPTDKPGGIVISLSSIEITGSKRHWKTKEALAFRKLVESAGLIEANEIRKAVLPELLPTGFTKEQLTAAIHLYSIGVSSEKLEEIIDASLDNLPALSETEKQSLYALPYLINTFEDFHPRQTIAIQSRYVPEIEISFSDAPPTENQFVLTSNGNTFQPLMEGALGQVRENVVGTARDKVTNFASNTIRKGGKNIRKEVKGKTGKAVAKNAKKLSGLLKKATQAGVKFAKTSADVGLAVTTGGVSLIAKKILGKATKWMAKHLIPKELREWINRNKGKLIAGAIGAIFALFAKLIFDILATILKVIAGFTLFVIFFTTLTLLIINNSAYLVPFNPDALSPGDPISMESPYIRVEKIASPSQVNNPPPNREIQYTITITPRQGTINNISFQSSCAVTKGGPQVGCPQEENITVNYPDLSFEPCDGEGHRCYPNDWTNCIDDLGSNPACPSSTDQCAATCDAPPGPTPTPAPVTGFPPPAPGVITPSLPYVITYTQTFDNNYEDSLITDTFTVTATSTTGVTTSASATAMVRIGTPPEDCPSGWPIAPEGSETFLPITQGPQGSWSHSTSEAIDVSATTGHTMTARHAGTAHVRYNDCYGNHVDIFSTCNGQTFLSRYAHLDSVIISDGAQVNLGQTIGYSGNTGPDCTTGAHLHYEFRDSSNVGGGKIYQTDPSPYMEPPWIPQGRDTSTGALKTIPRGCSDRSDCSTIIP